MILQDDYMKNIVTTDHDERVLLRRDYRGTLGRQIEFIPSRCISDNYGVVIEIVGSGT